MGASPPPHPPPPPQKKLKGQRLFCGFRQVPWGLSQPSPPLTQPPFLTLSPSPPPIPFSLPQEPGSPCGPFVGQIQSQKESIASQSCDNPIEVSATPTPACCALAMQFQPCACDADVHATSGKTLAIASYRSTAYVCGGKCVNAPKC